MEPQLSSQDQAASDTSESQDSQDQQDPISMLGQILAAMQQGFQKASPEVQKAVQGILDAYTNLVNVLGGKQGPMANASDMEGANPKAVPAR